MTRVSFNYGARDRVQAIVDWLSTAHDKSRRVTIYAPDDSLVERLDRMLWTASATGFLPHCLANSPLATETPIVIAQDLAQLQHDECLLNASDEVPPNFDRFSELVEIISIDDRDRLPGRERFRFYREGGYPMENRDISGGI